MPKTTKEHSSPFLTGGGGFRFEELVQATFATLMLAHGYSPGLPTHTIQKIHLQAKYQGWDTDDIVVHAGLGIKEYKLLGQIKHTVSITKSNKTFGEVIDAAWLDFNKPNFNTGKDAIALITGPLTQTDISNTRVILEWARSKNSAAEFMRQVKLDKHSNPQKRKKLKAFRTQLDRTSNSSISDDQLHNFLRHFHIFGFDLDLRSSLAHALNHTIIGQYATEKPALLFSAICNQVAWFNQNAGTITRDALPDEITDAFKPKGAISIPSTIAAIIPPDPHTIRTASKHATSLMIANIFGSWSTKVEGDLEVLSIFLDVPMEDWISSLKEILDEDHSPLTHQDGTWKIRDRKELWLQLEDRVFDDLLIKFKSCALAVLQESDPKLELDIEDRFAAQMYGKTRKYSEMIRIGIAETIALLGTHSSNCNNASIDSCSSTANDIVNELLTNQHWKTWASLDDVIPLLAEASPTAFLRAMDQALAQSPSPMEDLYRMETGGITGTHYLSSTLWALEAICWSEEYLIRATVILGKLTAIDPGGQWSNRPKNSLVYIYLPWLPQTTATIDKRLSGITVLQKHLPDVAWEVLTMFIPGKTRTSMHTQKPRYLDVFPSDWSEEVSHDDYVQQVLNYTTLLKDMALEDETRLAELVSEADNLPSEITQVIFNHISSITEIPNHTRFSLWNALKSLRARLVSLKDEKWRKSDEFMDALNKALSDIEPEDSILKYKRLFIEDDWDLYEDKEDNYEKQQELLEQQRQEAIQTVMDTGGLEAIFLFAQEVKQPNRIGIYLANLSCVHDSELLPSRLSDTVEAIAHVAVGYVISKFHKLGWSWFDENIDKNWAQQDILKVLKLIPFNSDNWTRAEQLLNNLNLAEYWRTVDVNPYTVRESLDITIKKLIQQARPHAAIDCMAYEAHKKLSIDPSLAIQALSHAVDSEENHNNHDIIVVIKALQNNPNTPQDSLLEIEWIYLEFLRSQRGCKPITLEKHLSTNPDAFIELIRFAYRSENDDKTKKHKPNEKDLILARKANRLLYDWRTPPGLSEDNEFDESKFHHWVQHAIESSEESGHLRPALSQLGQVLFFSPTDPSGLWIHKTIAQFIDKEEMKRVRDGYSIAAFNSRGMHWVDPSGKPEFELAQKYRDRASKIENEGLLNFADTLRALADRYDKDGRQILREHQDE